MNWPKGRDPQKAVIVVVRLYDRVAVLADSREVHVADIGSQERRRVYVIQMVD